MRFSSVAPAVAGLALFLQGLPAAATGPFTGRALSVGYPNSGKLVDGLRVHETAYMRVLPAYAKSSAKWALPSLLELLDRVSRRVAHRFPGSVLGIGELSSRDGGPIASHRSHQNGRDADVGFYLVNGKGRVLKPNKLVPCDGDGHSREITTTRFDERRNWALVEALLTDSSVSVRQIFVYAPLRKRLLAYAEKTGAPAALRERAAIILKQPARVSPHDDHFHIRIGCPQGQYAHGCIDDSKIRVAPAPAEEETAADGTTGSDDTQPVSAKRAAPAPADPAEE